jgi:hypothetical protein
MSMQTDRDAAGGDLVTRISRDDLSALAAAYKRAGRRAELAGGAGVLGGLGAAAVLLLLRGTLGWAPVLDAFFLAGGWAIALTSAALSWRRQRAALAAYQFACPACHAPMLTLRPWRSEVSRATLAASTGACPECGARICD